MKQYSVVASLLLAVCLAVVGIPATEQRAEAQAYEQWPCQEDMAKYCSGVTPGGGRLLACYEQQKSNMSGKWVSWAEYWKKNAGDLSAACSKEIDARCNSEKGDPLWKRHTRQPWRVGCGPWIFVTRRRRDTPSGSPF